MIGVSAPCQGDVEINDTEETLNDEWCKTNAYWNPNFVEQQQKQNETNLDFYF